jgi:hypothetical protein
MYKGIGEILAKKEALTNIHFSRLQNAISRVTAITGILVKLTTFRSYLSAPHVNIWSLQS